MAKIPNEIINAVVGLLQPYCDDLTPHALKERLSTSTRKSELLTIPEAAVEINTHPATLYRWIRDGQVQAHRIGRGRKGLRVFRHELLNSLET